MAKDSPRTTAGELQKIVESLGQKTLEKNVKQHLHHHVLLGMVSRKIILAHPKTNSSIFSYQTQVMTGTSNGTGFYGQMKLTNEHGIMDSIKYQQIKKINM